MILDRLKVRSILIFLNMVNHHESNHPCFHVFFNKKIPWGSARVVYESPFFFIGKWFYRVNKSGYIIIPKSKG